MLELRTDRVTNRVPFKRSELRRKVFWAAVLAAGTALGIYWAHPELSLIGPPTGYTRMAPGLALAELVANTLTFAALAILSLLIGVEKFIESPEQD